MKSPIAINDISVKFGDKAILDHLSYEFESGKIICLIGPSGAGKSTFIKAIVGMQKLDSGNVKILERKIPDSIWKTEKKLRRAKTILYNKRTSGGITIPDFKLHYRAIIKKPMVLA